MKKEEKEKYGEEGESYSDSVIATARRETIIEKEGFPSALGGTTCCQRFGPCTLCTHY